MSRNGPDVCDPAFGVGGTERQGGTEVKEAVPIIGVQSFLREKQHVRLVKIDTEGAEVQVRAGNGPTGRGAKPQGKPADL